MQFLKRRRLFFQLTMFMLAYTGIYIFLLAKYGIGNTSILVNLQLSGNRKTILVHAMHLYTLEPFFKIDSCEYTCDILRNQSNTEHADAIILPPRYMLADVNRKQEQDHLTFPKNRRPDQYWVFFLFDHFGHGHFDLMADKVNAFNISMTWKSDAHVRISYGYLERVNKILDINRWEKVFSETLSQKTKLVAWVVSQCVSKSVREIYAQELSKYVPVDIYGICGKNCDIVDGKPINCFEHLGVNYKFYLAFENSICNGYMTEKIFRAFHYDMVPIVLGGSNYSAFLPEKSFINVLDFETPKHLADYLLDLHKNKELYMEYFEWKKHYRVHGASDGLSRGLCDLCTLLHNPYLPKRTISNITHHILHDCNNGLMASLQQKWS